MTLSREEEPACGEPTSFGLGGTFVYLFVGITPVFSTHALVFCPWVTRPLESRQALRGENLFISVLVMRRSHRHVEKPALSLLHKLLLGSPEEGEAEPRRHGPIHELFTCKVLLHKNLLVAFKVV